MSTGDHPHISRRPLFLLLFALLALLSCDLFDIFPPEIEIVSPIDNASCVGTLSCDIDATDNRSVAKVELFLDNVSIHEFTNTPYKATVDISGQSAGTKTFKATAYDKAGNWAEAQRKVRIVKGTPTTVLVAYYPFNGNADDESGNGNHGTVNGAVLAADRFGNANSAYSFDGVDDYIDLPVSGSDFSNSITIAAWVYRTKSISGHPMMGIVNSDRSTDRGVALGNVQEDKVKFAVYKAEGMDYRNEMRGSVIPSSTWTFMALIYGENTLKGYIDDTLDGSESGSGTIGGTGNFHIGHHPYDSMVERYWGGLIDDIRIYNRALNAAEIQALYHEGGWDANPSVRKPDR